YVLNFSVVTQASTSSVERELRKPLLKLAEQLRDAIGAL
ncbi:MAG: hypothetical protein V7642_6563, partial [Burkholderiales bacterium]